MRGDKYGERALNAELDAGVSVCGGKYCEFELNPLPDARPDACGGGGTYDKLELTAEPDDSGGGCGGEYGEFELNPLPDAGRDACGGGGKCGEFELDAEPDASDGVNGSNGEDVNRAFSADTSSAPSKCWSMCSYDAYCPLSSGSRTDAPADFPVSTACVALGGMAVDVMIGTDGLVVLWSVTWLAGV